ncbi:putative membrane protein [Forsythia ovata]|uniref:Membrane protein n=1 Tax=Forsythia ovata TaxID=205694 RepID=A0ABD1PUN3_9LAMI
MKVKVLRCSSLPNNFLATLSSSASSSSTLSMVAPRGLMVESGGRVLDRDEEKNAESPTGKMFKAEKLPLSRWEFAAALGVFLVFSSGLLCIYLTMPAAEYGVLKLPRSLADIRILKDHLSKYAQVYPAKFILGYCSTYIFMQTFMIPGTIFMSLLAGALFGVKGIFLVVFNATAGASCCFFLSKLIGKPIVNWLWPERLRYFQAEIAKRREKLLNYMLFLRVTPTLPNLFINLASPIVDIPFHIFFLATVIGLIPASYITVRAGLALGDLKSVRDLYDVKTLALLFLIGSLLLVPTLLKRKRVYE